MFWGKSLNRQLQTSTRSPLRSVANMSDMAAILDNLALRETRWLEWQRCSAGGDDEKAHFYFENYCYHMRNALSEQQDKFNAGDKENAEAAVQEALDWLDIQRVSREANADEFEARQKELEGIVNPIILKAFLDVLEANRETSGCLVDLQFHARGTRQPYWGGLTNKNNPNKNNPKIFRAYLFKNKNKHPRNWLLLVVLKSACSTQATPKQKSAIWVAHVVLLEANSTTMRRYTACNAA